jgi:hypothetical protein
MEKDPLQADYEFLRGQMPSMFELLEQFDLQGRRLIRFNSIRKRFEKLKERHAKDRATLDRLKAKARTPQQVVDCIGRLNALFEKHTEQYRVITDQLIELTRSSMRG